MCVNRNETPQLFTVLPERRTGPVGSAMMASTHIYEMSAVSVSDCVCVRLKDSERRDHYAYHLSDVRNVFTQ